MKFNHEHFSPNKLTLIDLTRDSEKKTTYRNENSHNLKAIANVELSDFAFDGKTVYEIAPLDQSFETTAEIRRVWSLLYKLKNKVSLDGYNALLDACIGSSIIKSEVIIVDERGNLITKEERDKNKPYEAIPIQEVGVVMHRSLIHSFCNGLKNLYIRTRYSESYSSFQNSEDASAGGSILEFIANREFEEKSKFVSTIDRVIISTLDKYSDPNKEYLYDFSYLYQLIDGKLNIRPEIKNHIVDFYAEYSSPGIESYPSHSPFKYPVELFTNYRYKYNEEEHKLTPSAPQNYDYSWGQIRNSFESILTASGYDNEEKAFIMKSYDISFELFDELDRKSGEPYFRHLFKSATKVVRLLSKEGLKNKELVAAALLHDSVEDIEKIGEDRFYAILIAQVIADKQYSTGEKIEELRLMPPTQLLALATNREVARLVDAVTKKSGSSQFDDLQDKDIFVKILKGVDRLDNSQTFEWMPFNRIIYKLDENIKYIIPALNPKSFSDQMPDEEKNYIPVVKNLHQLLVQETKNKHLLWCICFFKMAKGELKNFFSDNPEAPDIAVKKAKNVKSKKEISGLYLIAKNLFDGVLHTTRYFWFYQSDSI